MTRPIEKNASWSEVYDILSDPRWAPAAYSIAGGLAGGALGWFYDKLQKKKEKDTSHRIGLGILAGSLAGKAGGYWRKAVFERDAALKDLDDLKASLRKGE